MSRNSATKGKGLEKFYLLLAGHDDENRSLYYMTKEIPEGVSESRTVPIYIYPTRDIKDGV